MMKLILISLFTGFILFASAQNDSVIKVHFLYGSKPLKSFKHKQQKWFGGMLGGHVGIEADSGQVLSFVPKGKFHWIANNNNRHSSYVLQTTSGFYNILGSVDSAKRLIIYVPVSAAQRFVFDSLQKAYLSNPPYDYALLGMRCGAATYELLSQIGVLLAYSYTATYLKIFYPKKLCKKLIKLANTNSWKMVHNAGTIERKWERD